jgi:hypothetical protein
MGDEKGPEGITTIAYMAIDCVAYLKYRFG